MRSDPYASRACCQRWMRNISMAASVNISISATVIHGNVRTGFVEFTSRSWAEMILKSYNGLGMPNYAQIYRLKWDMDATGMMWRWDYAYERCSYFGFNDAGEELNANKALLRYKHLIPAVNEKPAAGGGQQHQEGVSGLTYEIVEEILYNNWLGNRFLYLCMEELCKEKDGCYVIRTLKLSNLLSCSCKFDEKIGSIITCRYCADCNVPFELQKQAWLCTKDFGNRKKVRGLWDALLVSAELCSPVAWTSHQIKLELLTLCRVKNVIIFSREIFTTIIPSG
ncbi:uncharacterized protein LOC133718751 isoform X4 [Rosa rugosa]|uniref:uncharacterized protein LOC133718751 isoform X4 n=1 Tax=Rosa rugosa TaxID=74645 RepID=UPI002B410F24|nr:uncharacterized protein LOC133718751 isoform X4 [Rosa rugosa]